MSTPIADEFGEIRRRVDELRAERESMLAARPPASEAGEDTICFACEGGGWIAYGLGHNDPHFRVCDACNNPQGLPSP